MDDGIVVALHSSGEHTHRPSFAKRMVAWTIKFPYFRMVSDNGFIDAAIRANLSKIVLCVREFA